MTPMNADELLLEFGDRHYVTAADHGCCFDKEKETAWLRSALAGFLLGEADQMYADSVAAATLDEKTAARIHDYLCQKARMVANPSGV